MVAREPQAWLTDTTMSSPRPLSSSTSGRAGSRPDVDVSRTVRSTQPSAWDRETTNAVRGMLDHVGHEIARDQADVLDEVGQGVGHEMAAHEIPCTGHACGVRLEDGEQDGRDDRQHEADDVQLPDAAGAEQPGDQAADQ